MREYEWNSHPFTLASANVTLALASVNGWLFHSYYPADST